MKSSHNELGLVLPRKGFSVKRLKKRKDLGSNYGAQKSRQVEHFVGFLCNSVVA